MDWILKCLAAMIGRLSAPSTDRLARFLTWLAFDLLRVRRRLVLRNLEIAFGREKTPEERLEIGRASIYHFFLTILEFFRSGKVDIAGDVEIKGAEHIRSALGQGHGAYILCFHLGNWEAMGAKFTRAIAPAHVLVKKVGRPSIDRFVSEMRLRSGFLGVPRQKKGDGYRAIKEILGRGEIVGFVMDQARPGEPRLPFFGHPAKTNTSFAAIWKRQPAPVLPSFILRKGVGRHVIEILPPLEIPVTGDAEKDILRQSEYFNTVVESCIRRCPEQYFWMHNRWK